MSAVPNEHSSVSTGPCEQGNPPGLPALRVNDLNCEQRARKSDQDEHARRASRVKENVNLHVLPDPLFDRYGGGKRPGAPCFGPTSASVSRTTSSNVTRLRCVHARVQVRPQLKFPSNERPELNPLDSTNSRKMTDR